MDSLASDFDYHLPEELIAQTPLEDRAGSRLLHLARGTGQVSHRTFREAPSLLEEGDLLVFNDTKVTALRLFGHRATGGRVEALLFGATGRPGEFRALCRPAKKLRLGDEVFFEEGLLARVTGAEDEGFRLLEFGGVEDLEERLRRAGETPLPPYIHERLSDPSRYQTVYAERPGSAAAPTAGLHFTREVLLEMEARGVKIARVTLDVSIDTFRPMTAERASDHVMHGERCEVPPETALAIQACRGRIIAVGTTSVRTLETFAAGPRTVESGERVSRLFITPGFQFQVVDGMFTNFHMPKTTMMFMISALAGREAVMSAYREAVAERYRFLSFGDSMLIL